MTKFSGFAPESIAFLTQAKARNNKTWFEAHRSDYQKFLLNPFRNLVTDLIPLIQSIDTEIEVRPTVNKTISRIFRDTRFSKDKSLFRDSMWLVFKRPGNEWSTSIPAFYFEIMPASYRYGMGFYAAAPKIMEAFRTRIDDQPQKFLNIIEVIRRDGRYNLEGEDYKRPPACTHAAAIRPWYHKKSFYLACNRKPDELLYSMDLINVLESGFLLLQPLYAGHCNNLITTGLTFTKDQFFL
jgi:uncharacterized protein (TIGR02453 family)